MNFRQQGLRLLAIVVSLALIAGAFFNFNFSFLA